jgi:hypothetical protein
MNKQRRLSPIDTIEFGYTGTVQLTAKNFPLLGSEQKAKPEQQTKKVVERKGQEISELI